MPARCGVKRFMRPKGVFRPFPCFTMKPGRWPLGKQKFFAIF